MRDHLLGFPPALLALDPEPRVSRETPPRPPACYEADKELVRFERARFRVDITEADCKQIKPSVVHEWEIIVGESVPEAAPPSATKFKVGDRVRVIADGGGEVRPGATGVLKPARDTCATYTMGLALVIDGSPNDWCWQPHWLELIAAPAPAQPTGVWVLTSERKPPKIGAYMIRRQRAPDQPFERQWDGSGFLMAFGNQHLVSQENTEWLDTSPQPDAEGWIAHMPGPCPVAAGTRIDFKYTLYNGLSRSLFGVEAGDGPEWASGAITHYRVVK